MGNTGKGAPYPDLTDSPNGPVDVQALAQWVDDRPGVSSLTYAQINALTGEDLWTGRIVFQTNTGTARPVAGQYEYNGVDWRLDWNRPWGLIAEAFTTAPTTAIAAATDITGLSLTFQAISNRRYIFKIQQRISKSATGGDVAVSVTDPGNTSQWQQRKTVPASATTTFQFEFPVPSPDLAAFAAGTVTRKARAQAFADTCAADEEGAGHNRFAVYDDGPIGAPA